MSEADRTREHLIATYRKKAKHYDITSRLYPVPGYQLKGDVLVMAEKFDPLEGADFVDLPDERAAFLAVINLIAGAERTGEPRKNRLRG